MRGFLTVSAVSIRNTDARHPKKMRRDVPGMPNLELSPIIKGMFDRAMRMQPVWMAGLTLGFIPKSLIVLPDFRLDLKRVVE